MNHHPSIVPFRLRIFLVLFSLLQLLTANAQNRLDQPIPVDNNIRIGKLENGLTYYIRKNTKPEKRVELRLAVNAGSVLEEDDQQGLAHFVEHMAFNGTKNFAKNDLVKYLQSVGVKFGPEINAYTSFDETVYMLTLPTDSVHILEKGFQIMEDWAHNLSFDATEIDKERGVIVEEWRLGRGPFQRMQDKYLPLVFKGSKYAERLPIGKKEIIEGAAYDRIRKFYTDWYRPDLMAFVVVGDIDPDAMEKAIREHFGQLKDPAAVKPRNNFTVPDQPGTISLVTSDKEAPYTLVQLICKQDPFKEVYQKDYRSSLAVQLVTAMLNQRLDELKEQANPPILYSAVQFGSLGTREKDALQLAGLVPEGGIELGIQTLVAENERVLQFGFTTGELERKKKQFLASYENAYNERDKTESEQFSAEYIRNFLTAEPIPGIEFEYNFVKEYIDGISLEEINETARKLITRDNRVVIVMAPLKDNVLLPDNEKILALVTDTEKSGIQPYVDKISGEQLMSEQPKKGRIMFTKKNDALGVIEMTLSNGAKVVLKPTDFKNDEILFRAFSPGGYSVYNTNDNYSAMNASDIIAQSGIGEYSPNDISKLLAGKTLTLNTYISAYYEGARGMAAPKDLESLFQLAYLSFTQPRKDTSAFASYIAKQKGVVKNMLSDPENYFDDQYLRIRTQNSPWADIIPTEADIDKINFDRVFEIYKDRFSDASGFTFLLVGSFKVDSIKPFIETYLASLPSLKKEENWKDLGIRAPSKKTDKAVFKGHEPKSIVGIYIESPATWDAGKSHIFASLDQLLDIRYTEVLREELSSIYGMGIRIGLTKIPYSHLETSIYIPCSPENADKLTKAALEEIRKIQEDGVNAEDLNKVKEAQRRELERELLENDYWIGQLMDVYRLGDPGIVTEIGDRINALTSEKLQEAARTINLKNYIRVVLYPEKSGKAQGSGDK